MKLNQIAKTIRSKNAGVDKITFDVIFPDRASYERGPRDVAFRCHFCGSEKLAEWEPAAAAEARL